MRTILCEIWLYANLLGAAFFVSSIYRWAKRKKKSYLLLALGVACIIIPGLTYLNSVKVINVVGLKVDSARQTLQSSGLQVELDFNDTYSDIVLRQNISPDSYVKKGTPIILYNEVETYSPTEELLEMENQKESTNLLFPAVNLEEVTTEDIAAEYEEFIGSLIDFSNLRNVLPLDIYRNVTFKVFEKAGTAYYKNGDSIISVDLLGKKIATSYLLIVDYDTLSIVNTYEIENGIIEYPFRYVTSGKYFVVLLSNNYKVYIWGPIQLKNSKPRNLSFSSVSFALAPEDAVFSDIKCIQVENADLNNSKLGRLYFMNAISIFEKDTIEPVSSAPSSIVLRDITAFSPYGDALDISSVDLFQPVVFQNNNYGYLSSIYYNNSFCAFSVSDRYMLRIEHKKTDVLDFSWENRYFDINFLDYDGNIVVIDDSDFLKCG